MKKKQEPKKNNIILVIMRELAGCYLWSHLLFKANADETTEKRGKDYWGIAVLSIYIIFNFSYVLFYTTFVSKSQYKDFVAKMWSS